LASWYSPRLHGRKTASGERFDVEALTAAHRSLPLGTRVEVHNPANGQRVVVRINDRGPNVRGVMLDLSPRAAHILGLIERGRGKVEITLVPASDS
jgi:rare lipoprotein A